MHSFNMLLIVSKAYPLRKPDKLTATPGYALCRLEKIANFYDPASELSYVNRTAFVSPVVLSEELYSMIDLCLEYNGKTLGCFDITVHSENYNQNTIQSVHLSVEDHSIYFSQPGVAVNLSGFLKGYALETIKRYVQHGEYIFSMVDIYIHDIVHIYPPRL